MRHAPAPPHSHAHACRTPSDRHAALLIDLDLSILAAVADAYERYVAQLRGEYAQVDNAKFREGPRNILPALRARAQLSATPQLHDSREAPARRSLRRELAQWAGDSG